ncbi:hypothetical protein ACJX0J_035408, partial [Zea mays]
MLEENKYLGMKVGWIGTIGVQMWLYSKGILEENHVIFVLMMKIINKSDCTEGHGDFNYMQVYLQCFIRPWCYGSNLSKILAFVVAFVDDMCLKIHIYILYIHKVEVDDITFEMDE